MPVAKDGTTMHHDDDHDIDIPGDPRRLRTVYREGFNWKPDAPEPVRWKQFLVDIWGDDRESIETLQEIFGLMILANTSHQKIFLLIGPPRSGKGVICRILMAVLGAENVCAPTLASLSTQFGLAPLIGKLAAIVTDARLSARAEQATIAERLLSISGEDVQTIDRKYDPAGWTGRLSARFLIMSNELPRLTDSSGALASRFVVLTMRNSFLGREDLGLYDKLAAELPGIFNWSLAGYDRLRKRGHFRQPETAREAIQELQDLGSPVGAFVRGRCEVGPGLSVARAALYDAWKRWCEDVGREHPGTEATFGRDLRAAVPGLASAQPRIGGDRIRMYEGIGLI